MTNYNAKCLVPLEAPSYALQYAIDRTAREVTDKVLGEIRNKECCLIRMDERQYGEPMTNSIAVHCRIDIDELVRCKDCKHQKFYFNDNESFHCDQLGVVNMHMEDGDGEFFCKYGERREPDECE